MGGRVSRETVRRTSPRNNCRSFADLGASGHRIPSGVGPFDRCGVGHVQTFEGDGTVAHSRVECTFPADY